MKSFSNFRTTSANKISIVEWQLNRQKAPEAHQLHVQLVGNARQAPRHRRQSHAAGFTDGQTVWVERCLRTWLSLKNWRDDNAPAIRVYLGNIEDVVKQLDNVHTVDADGTSKWGSMDISLLKLRRSGKIKHLILTGALRGATSEFKQLFKGRRRWCKKNKQLIYPVGQYIPILSQSLAGKQVAYKTYAGANGIPMYSVVV